MLLNRRNDMIFRQLSDLSDFHFDLSQLAPKFVSFMELVKLFSSVLFSEVAEKKGSEIYIFFEEVFQIEHK